MRIRDRQIKLCWIFIYDSKGRVHFSKFYESISRGQATRVMNRCRRVYARKVWDSGDHDTYVYGGWDATRSAFDNYILSQENPEYFANKAKWNLL